jgi:benzylsuccinate CoA-transferase BbsF subunit
MHTDFTVPYFATMQILAALHHRDRTGVGAYLELSQYESSVRLMDVEVSEVLNGGAAPGRIANRSRWYSPHGIYPAAGDDRWVAIACRDDAERARLASVLGHEPSDAAVAAWTQVRSRESVVETLRSVRVPVSAVEDLRDHHADAAMRESWARLDLPSGVSAEVLHEPITFDGERLPLRRAPLWSEHTYEVVVDELALDPVRFAELLDSKVLW